jgi:succinate dehydrogenase / fumarate reductase cytochrome b subunit
LALFLVPLVVHAGLGVWRLLRVPDSPLNGPRGLRILQAVTGALALAFVAWHLRAMWATGDGPHADARAAYQALFEGAGRPAVLVPYLIGVTAVCFHFAHGIGRAAVSVGLARSQNAVLVFRTAGFAVGFVLWALLLQLLAQFAIGQPVL